MKNLTQWNNNLLVKFIILLLFFNISVLAGSVTKETRSNVYKIFYKINKKTDKYVKSRMNKKNEDQVCQKLYESVDEFKIAANITGKHDLFLSKAKKMHKENPSYTTAHYYFNNLKKLRAEYFSHEFNKFLFRVKITNKDLENIYFHDIDITKHTLQNIYSLDNEYDAGEASFKNINKMVLIQEAIGLSSYELLYEMCEKIIIMEDGAAGAFYF